MGKEGIEGWRERDGGRGMEGEGWGVGGLDQRNALIAVMCMNYTVYYTQ